MPIMDSKLLFSQEQAVTSLGSAPSTNVVNTGDGQDWFGSSVASDVGEGGGLWLNVIVDTAFTSGTSAATMQVALQDSPSETAGSFADVVVTAAKPVGDLTAGARVWRQPLPADLDQYLRLNYTVAASAMTAGKLTAWIGLESETPR